mgnify:CR=1 FL=1
MRTPAPLDRRDMIGADVQADAHGTSPNPASGHTLGKRHMRMYMCCAMHELWVTKSHTCDLLPAPKPRVCPRAMYRR